MKKFLQILLLSVALTAIVFAASPGARRAVIVNANGVIDGVSEFWTANRAAALSGLAIPNWATNATPALPVTAVTNASIAGKYLLTNAPGVLTNETPVRVNVLGDSLSQFGTADSLAALHSLNPSIVQAVYAIGSDRAAMALSRLCGLMTAVTATAGDTIVRAKQTQPARLVDVSYYTYWQQYRGAVVSNVTAKFYGNGLLLGEVKQDQYLAQVANGSSTVTLYQPGARTELLNYGSGELITTNGSGVWVGSFAAATCARLTTNVVNIITESASFAGAEQAAFLANSSHVNCHKLTGIGSGTSYIWGKTSPVATTVYRVKLKMFCPASNNSYGKQAPTLNGAIVSLGTYATSQWVQYEYVVVGWNGQIVLGSAPNDAGDVFYLSDVSVKEEWVAPTSLGFSNTETCWTDAFDSTTCDQFGLTGGATYPASYTDTGHSARYRGLYVGSVGATTMTLSLTSGGAAISAGANGWMLLNGGWQLAHTVASGETISVVPELPADTANDIWVVWLGTNDPSLDASSYLSIRRILGPRRTIWMTPLPSQALGADTVSRLGDACRFFLNQNMQNVCDVLPYLMTKGSGTGQDQLDVANVYTPSSLRLANDNVHLSTGLNGGYDMVWRNLVAPKGRTLGWW